MSQTQYVKNGVPPNMGEPSNGGTEYQPSFEPPYLIPILGHAGAGKDTFKKWLGARFSEAGFRHRLVINFKERDSRSTETEGFDYERILSEAHGQKLVRDGRIIVPYKHDGRRYGLSDKIVEAVNRNESAVMITEPDGLYSLSQYAQYNLQNMIISILLHTDINEADRRLVARARSPLKGQEIRDINIHREGLPREFELYRSIEDMCRYVLRNDTINGQDEHTSVRYLVQRAAELVNLEKELRAPTTTDFRESYANLVVKRLFGTSLEDLVASATQGLELIIPQDAIDSFAADNKLDPKTFESITRQPIVAVVDGYGILSLYVKVNQGGEQEKKYWVDLIRRAVQLTPQYTNPEILLTKKSEQTLKESTDANGDYLDFAISFSAYDPMKAPPRESRIHTIAFEGVLSSGTPRIEPVSIDKAKKIIEGNGH